MTSRSIFGWLIIGVGLGFVAQKLLSKNHPDKNPWDVDSVLKACDKAAEKLESLTTGHDRHMGATS